MGEKVIVAIITILVFIGLFLLFIDSIRHVIHILLGKDIDFYEALWIAIFLLCLSWLFKPEITIKKAENEVV